MENAAGIIFCFVVICFLLAAAGACLIAGFFQWGRALYDIIEKWRFRRVEKRFFRMLYYSDLPLHERLKNFSLKPGNIFRRICGVFVKERK